MNDAEITAAIDQFINAQQREQASLTLAANASPAVIAALVARVSQVPPVNEFQRQAYAAYALGLMGPAAVQAAQPMIDQLAGNEIHDGTRQHIVRALGAIAPNTPMADAALAALQEEVVHPNPTIRRKAVQAIEEFF